MSRSIGPEVAKALNLVLLLHADHEQNCSTSTVRLVGSARANMFASVAAGILALICFGAAFLALWKMEETYGKDLDFQEKK